ncbi:TolC family protein [bacterium]|nr:TolC family protein [bacterium]
MRFYFIVLIQLILQPAFGQQARPAPNVSSFWNFVERATQDHPKLLAKDAVIRSESARAKDLGWLEDPSIELIKTDRVSSGQSSTVDLVALKQKLPFWSERSRQQEVQLALVEAAKLSKQDTSRSIKAEIISLLYEYARALQEQHHLKERRERLRLIKTSLVRTKSSSPTQQLERDLIESAILLTEQQFDLIDSSAAELRKRLLNRGLPSNSTVSVNWIDANTFKDFQTSLNGVNLKPNLKTEIHRALVDAAEKNRLAMRPRPEFDLLLQSDQERGGAKERNVSLGLNIKIPINSLFGNKKDIGQSEVERSKSELHFQEQLSNLERDYLKEEIKLVEKSLSRFEISKISKIEKVVSKAEKDVRRGWISIAQLLELERQMHSQIEATFDAQIKAVELINRSCEIFNCEARSFLGGQL